MFFVAAAKTSSRLALRVARPGLCRATALHQHARQASQMASRLRLGSPAPNFTAKTTAGDMDFHQFAGHSWVVLFSHPADKTPVCTTELGKFARMQPEFEQRGVKLVGLSADDVDAHTAWAKDIADISNSRVAYPIIADADRKVSVLYDLLDHDGVAELQRGGHPLTMRYVYVIDPAKNIRLMLAYPGAVGRNVAEVLRCVDALQTADRLGVATPENWAVGDDVIVPPSVSTEDARKKFGDVREVKPYLRFVRDE